MQRSQSQLRRLAAQLKDSTESGPMIATFDTLSRNQNPDGSPIRKADLGSRPDASQLQDNPDTKMDKEGLRKARLELLAAMLWAKIGDPQATIKETDPNELTLELGDLSWVITVSDEGKISISGFDSGVEQYIGKMPENDTEISLVEIADNAVQLINDDIDENEQPPEDPIHFGPEDEEGTDSSEVELGDEQMPPPPETAQGDEMATPGGGEMPMDAGMEAPMPGASPDMASAGMPPPPAAPGTPPPGGMPPPPVAPGMPMQPPAGMPPPPPQGQPMMPGMPQATRRSVNREQITGRIRKATRKVAILQLEQAAGELESLSASLEGKDSETFKNLATRIDRVTNTLEQE